MINSKSKLYNEIEKPYEINWKTIHKISDVPMSTIEAWHKGTENPSDVEFSYLKFCVAVFYHCIAGDIFKDLNNNKRISNIDIIETHFSMLFKRYKYERNFFGIKEMINDCNKGIKDCEDILKTENLKTDREKTLELRSFFEKWSKSLSEYYNNYRQSFREAGSQGGEPS